MSSSTWSNYSNQAAALRSSIQAPEQQDGAETENDRKAFLAESIQGTAQFIKERVGEKVLPAIASTGIGSKLVSAYTGKAATPLKDAAKAAAKAAKDASRGIDEAGMEESENLAGFAARTAAAKATQVAAQSESDDTAIDAALAAARTATTGTLRVASTAAQAGSALTRESVDEAAAADLRTPAETLLSRLVPINSAADSAAGGSAASAADAAGSSAASAAGGSAARAAASSAAKLEEAGQGVRDAEEAEGAAKDAAEVAKAARVAKALKDAKEAEGVADASEEGGDIFGVVIGGLIALGTAFIGSRVQVHDVVKAPPPNTSEVASYGSVAGA